MPKSPVERLTFTIGEAFPADSADARWLTVLAMASNDFLRLFGWLAQACDDGTRVLAFRIIASAFMEAATHLDGTIRRFSDIARFVAELDDEARDEAERVRGAIDPESPHYLGPWLEGHRNVTFHYAEMHPLKAEHGKEELSEALRAAAPLSGAISYPSAVAITATMLHLIRMAP
jgi:hypothetical protein